MSQSSLPVAELFDPAGSPGTAALVSVRGVSVVRQGNTILRDIDVQIPTGSVFGIIGPSGSGKTTLIRSIIGLQRISAGSIRIGGLPAGSAELRQSIGYMPQSSGVYADLSARENLDFLRAVFRVPPGRVDEVLKDVDLLGIADRMVATYSGGERQRVSLAGALLPRPRLLLLDEPTVGLDPRLRYRLWSKFRAWASEGAAVVVTTHVMDEAAKTDRLALLSKGRIVAEGSPAELLERAGVTELEDAVLALTPDPELKTGGPA